MQLEKAIPTNNSMPLMASADSTTSPQIESSSLIGKLSDTSMESDSGLLYPRKALKFGISSIFGNNVFFNNSKTSKHSF